MQSLTTLETKQCPLCGGTDLEGTVWRDSLPTMQNYVHRTHESATATPQEQFLLAVCRSCGFAWNCAFDEDRLTYDSNYDNAVLSAVMDSYYREIATFLDQKYDLKGGLVVDIGCGSGAFLRALCNVQPLCRGLGIDPALEQDHEEEGGRISLIKDEFSAALISEPPALIVCRHVLEHIPKLVEFLRNINTALAEFGSCPCFFEVPELGWIVENDVFWDFCYEHCNYFTSTSLAEALRRAGFEPKTARSAFGLQYQWMEALSGREQAPAVGQITGNELAEQMLRYAATEAENIASTRDLLQQKKSEGCAIAVWGMATKGVLFSLLVDPESSLIDYCIDVNPNKQGCFVPLTGHTISAPDTLRESHESQLLIVVMNENYHDEILKTCREMRVEPMCLSASGASI